MAPEGYSIKFILESYPALALGVYVPPYSFVYITFSQEIYPFRCLLENSIPFLISTVRCFYRPYT